VVLRGDHEANPEKLTQILGGVHAELADEALIRKATGAATGFAGPMGLAGKVGRMIIDHGVAAMAVGVAGANKTDYHVKHVVPGRDFPLEGENITIADVRLAVEGDTLAGKKLLFKRGIEVGQVFKLGSKYSRKLGATFLDEKGQDEACLMGCYGIGINRIVASAIETLHDKDGIVWPISIAPFECLITTVNHEDAEVAGAAETLYEQLLAQGVEVLLDDRPVRGGVKFKDADLIGIPIRVTVGKRGLKNGNLEVKLRRDKEAQAVPVDEVAATVLQLREQLYGEINGQ